MIDKVVINQTRTEAIIYMENRIVRLYHSEGKVLDLLAIIIGPWQNIVSSWDSLMSQNEDTVNLSLLDSELLLTYANLCM